MLSVIQCVNSQAHAPVVLARELMDLGDYRVAGIFIFIVVNMPITKKNLSKYIYAVAFCDDVCDDGLEIPVGYQDFCHSPCCGLVSCSVGYLPACQLSTDRIWTLVITSQFASLLQCEQQCWSLNITLLAVSCLAVQV